MVLSDLSVGLLWSRVKAPCGKKAFLLKAFLVTFVATKVTAQRLLSGELLSIRILFPKAQVNPSL